MNYPLNKMSGSMTQLAKIQTCNYDSIVRKHQKFSSKVRVNFLPKI